MGSAALVIAHGSRDPEWVGLVDEAVEPVRGALPIPVETAFLELVPGRLIQDGIDRLERQGADTLIVVPLFVSSGSVHLAEITEALGAVPAIRSASQLPPLRTEAAVHLCGPVDADPDVIDILLENASSLSRHPAGEVVIVIGHGSPHPGFDAAWRRTLQAAAERLRERGGFAAAGFATLQPDTLAGTVADWRLRRPELTPIAVPMFIAEGWFTSKAIPSRLEGLEVRYESRGLLPHRLISRWLRLRIEEKVKELAKP